MAQLLTGIDSRAVTVSRQELLDSIDEAWQAADEAWKVGEGEQVILEEVMETACRFVQALTAKSP